MFISIRGARVVFWIWALFTAATVAIGCASTGSSESTSARANTRVSTNPKTDAPSVQPGQRESARENVRSDRPNAFESGLGESVAESPSQPRAVPRDEMSSTIDRRPATPTPVGSGRIAIDVADIAGRPLPASVEIRDANDREFRVVNVASGSGSAEAPAGPVKAYVRVFDDGAPILVDVHDLTVPKDGVAPLQVRVLEGASGHRKLHEFDQDFDLALDRVELEVGTDPADSASVPGIVPIQWPSPVLSTRGQWYRGDLHVHSRYGIGKESVSELVRRAERSGLDFMAIADRNTIQAALDPGFRSNSVVLIPAMEWGNDELGVGLVLAPRTLPVPTDSIGYAQAMLYRLQSQGGLFFVAHPTFANAPWQWGLSYVNGVETWCRPWRQSPPLWLGRLREEVRVREEGELIRSIARAAATQGYSANGQATWFYDHELTRGLKACAIGGSYSVGPEMPLGRPLTYVFATEKSLKGILDGLRWGRTFISHGPEGPKIAFMADVLVDDTIDTGVGGYVPLNVPTRFRVEVEDAPQGSTLQILLNGSVFRSTKVRWENDFAYEFDYVPENYATFRVRIVRKPTGQGFGVNEMLAMTSPIYALDVVPEIPGAEDNIWLNIEHHLFRPGSADRLPGNPAVDEYRTITPSLKF